MINVRQEQFDPLLNDISIHLTSVVDRMLKHGAEDGSVSVSIKVKLEPIVDDSEIRYGVVPEYLPQISYSVKGGITLSESTKGAAVLQQARVRRSAGGSVILEQEPDQQMSLEELFDEEGEE